jgi:hypothetical protein
MRRRCPPSVKAAPLRDERLIEEARQLRELAGFMRPGMSQAMTQRARQVEAAALPRSPAVYSLSRYSR